MTNKQSEPAGPSISADPYTSEFLDGLAKALETSDDLGANVNDKLAEIINKR